MMKNLWLGTILIGLAFVAHFNLYAGIVIALLLIAIDRMVAMEEKEIQRDVEEYFACIEEERRQIEKDKRFLKFMKEGE